MGVKGTQLSNFCKVCNFYPISEYVKWGQLNEDKNRRNKKKWSNNHTAITNRCLTLFLNN